MTLDWQAAGPHSVLTVGAIVAPQADPEDLPYLQGYVFLASGSLTIPGMAEARGLTRQANVRCGLSASGASVDQVYCLVRADIDIGHVRRLTVGVFPAQIDVTILAPR
jgi:hypothetical protein